MKKLIEKIREILRNRRFRKIWMRTVSSIACLVVFVTTYALVLPAITMESEALCGIEAHQHSESCYEERLICNLPESDGHVHTDACYSTVQKLICDRPEHLHTLDCYDAEGNLVCGQEEHQHGADCFEETRELICGLEESAGHRHDASCYEKVLICGKEAHTHSPACYREDAASAAATEGAAAATTAGSEDNSVTADDAGSGESTNALGTPDPAQTASGGYVPALDELDLQQSLNSDTAISNHPPADDETTGSGISDAEKALNDSSLAEENIAETVEETHPAVSFEDSLTVHTGSLRSDITGNSDSEGDSTGKSDSEGDSTGNSGSDAAVSPDTATDAGSLPASSNLTVSVSAEAGTFPAGTTMVLSAVTDMDAVAEAVEGTVDSKTRGFQAVDISFRDKDGNEIEPLKPISVTMRSDSIKAATEDSSMAPVVVHVEDRNKETAETYDNPAATVIETLPDTTENKENSESSDSANTAVNSPDTISFEADSFSIYAIVYTVDFHWEVNGKEYDFSIPGGGFVTLQQLVEVLGIVDSDTYTENVPDDAGNSGDFSEEETTLNNIAVSEKTREFVADVATVEFSSPDLVWVGKIEEKATVGHLKSENGLEVQYSADLSEEQIGEINGGTVEDGDWALISMLPFTSEETLTVTMKTGEQFVVKVTDAQKIKKVITTSDKILQVTVEVRDGNDIARFEDLRVEELSEDTDAYREAYEAVVSLKGAEDENFDEEKCGFLAADIELLDKDGEAFEPEGTVYVKMELLQLPAEESVLTSTMEIQHLAEQDGKIDVQTVASAENITKVDDVVTAEFSVESFSTFTLTWTDDGSSTVISDQNASTTLNIQNENGDTYATVTVHYIDANGNNILSPITSAVNGTTPVTIGGLLNREIEGYEYQGAYYNSYNGESINSIVATREQTTTTGDVYKYLGTTSNSYYGYGGGQINGSSTAPSGYTEFYADEQGNTRIFFRNQRFRKSDSNSGQVYANGPVYGKTTGNITSYIYTLSFDNPDISNLTNTNTTGTWNNAADIYLVYSSEEELSAATIHYGERVNGQFVEFDNEKVAILDASAGSVSIANYFEDYVYSISHYQYGSEDYVIDPNLYKVRGEDDKYNWQADMYVTSGSSDTTSKVRRPIADGSDIYVEYVKRTDVTPNPGTPEGVEGPVTHKSVYPTLNEESDEDGTYTIQLDVTGNVQQEVNKVGANVMIVLDRTKSMRYNMSNDNIATNEANNRWTAALGAVDVLLDTLSTGLNANNDVEYSLMTFYQRADDASSWSGSNWTTDASDVSTAVHNTDPIGANDNTNNGTNWEDPLYRAGLLLNSKQATDTDKTYIIFVTDGQPNARGTGVSGNNYTG